MRRKIIYVVVTILSLTLVGPALCFDEDAYVRFAVDSTITLHRLKGNPRAMDLWGGQMQERHPDYMGEGFQSIAERLKRDPSFKSRIYNRILTGIKSQGHNAKMVDLGEGITTIEIQN